MTIYEDSVRIGVDIGGTTMSVARVLDNGDIVGRIDIPSPARESGTRVVEEITGIVRHTWPTAQSVGIGAAGVIDAEGTILAASDSFNGWAGFALGHEIRQALGIPVGVENDVNAFLLGETYAGVLSGVDSCLGLMLGTGVGGAIMLDGHILHGQHGAAAEIGHMPGFGDLPCTCGGRGHIETTSSGRAIATRYASATGKPTAHARHVSQAARAGDAIAVDILRDAGRYAGLAIIQTATMLDLTAVVIGGGVTRDWDYLMEGITEMVTKHPLISGGTLEIHRSLLGADAVLIGAARKGGLAC
ncbi:ROK family protein [Arcanobacterium pinnipediorum]|uniref:ROK family protein n=1 Tax=Arcanobacterium pinnipediorum TaxID=1503041 RepID=A0ABY5AHG4_9ACTO|nr:ROK family protein [Arcanobacterium pinnipediorum]USR79446.1 ROK family protein [Arcanobacterium pinnipediorum]